MTLPLRTRQKTTVGNWADYITNYPSIPTRDPTDPRYPRAPHRAPFRAPALHKKAGGLRSLFNLKSAVADTQLPNKDVQSPTAILFIFRSLTVPSFAIIGDGGVHIFLGGCASATGNWRCFADFFCKAARAGGGWRCRLT